MMRGMYIEILREAHKRRWPGPVPPPEQLVWLPFVGPFLQSLRPVSQKPPRVLATEPEEAEACHG